MQFDSYAFVLVFLPLTLLVYYIARKNDRLAIAKCVLIVASFIFYSWSNVRLGFFLLVFVVAHYGIYCAIVKTSKRFGRLIGVLGIVFSIAFLCLCKYYTFFADGLNRVLKSDWSIQHVFIPLGISFITFQQIAFIVDAMRGDVPSCSFLDYMLYVTFFPKIISGPITVPSALLPQINRETWHISWKNSANGLALFAMGLGKKVIVADNVGHMVDWAFSADPNILGAAGALAAALGYAFQIYFDFSGYSDMACGVSQLFGFRLPTNFNSPYQALNISDFWKRWHISLTSFLREYVYRPLGGNRKGKIRTYINTIAVFLISGLWHGTNQTFVLWGGLHGIALVLYKIFKKRIDGWNVISTWLITFGFVSITWIFFRADSISHAWAILRQLWRPETVFPSEMAAALLPRELMYVVSFLGMPAGPMFWVWILMILMLLIVLKKRNSQAIANERDTLPVPLRAMFYALLIVVSVCSFSSVSEFVYGAF